MDSGSYDHGLNAEPDKNVYKKNKPQANICNCSDEELTDLIIIT